MNMQFARNEYIHKHILCVFIVEKLVALLISNDNNSYCFCVRNQDKAKDKSNDTTTADAINS